MSAELDRLAELEAKATPGPWLIWREPLASPADAMRALSELVAGTHPVGGTLYMLEAGGACPALTGHGPTSEANAELIAALRNAAPALLAAAREAEELRAWQREAVLWLQSASMAYPPAGQKHDELRDLLARVKP